MIQIDQLRKNYKLDCLREESVDKNPFTQFERWLQDAIDASILEPTAMTLSTATKEGVPSSRMVLLKEWSKNGGIFFTNSKSQKAFEIETNPVASALFWWKELERQVAISGTIKKMSPQKTYEYFSSRPFKSQIAAWVSMQGEPLTSKEVLQSAFEALLQKWKSKKVPLPPHWRGYRLIPFSFQFWQGQPDRLHDRFLYLKEGKRWSLKRLYP